MTPETDASFWAHMPIWIWPIIAGGVLMVVVYEAVKASEAIARVFGRVGHAIHERAIAPRRTLSRVEHIEEILERTSDKLECATSYLVIDAEYHHEADVLIAEHAPAMLRILPRRMSFVDFSRKWTEDGWRP